MLELGAFIGCLFFRNTPIASSANGAQNSKRCSFASEPSSKQLHGTTEVLLLVRFISGIGVGALDMGTLLVCFSDCSAKPTWPVSGA
jgi:hypothetical protein